METVIGVAGDLSKSKAIQNAANYNAYAAENNARLEREAAAEEERRFRISSKKKLGSIRAAVGASGITMSGSALAVLEESAGIAELDALTIRHAGEVRATGFAATAGLERMRSRSAKTEGYYNAASTLLSGASKAATMAAG